MTNDIKQEKKTDCPSRRKAAAYLHGAASYVSDNPEYPVTWVQSDLIYAYAEKNGMDIVKTYSDVGKSRKGLKSMIADVHSSAAEYGVILMHDITHWGRFQDIDESAHYEFICRRAGVEVHYVEPFVNDGSITSSVIKAVKRAMEGEYRRERAAKAKAARLRRKARMAEAIETEGVHE